jgi:hypothetical protein
MLLRLMCVSSLAVLFAASASAAAPSEFSAAEQALFVANHLGQLRPPTTLRYRFGRSGSLEPGFDDSVAVVLRAQADGQCCTAATEFLSGPRRLLLPEIEAVQGNPAILYFLEHDIREMQRRTKGQANYFRKRIRMAVAESATITELSLPWRGASVKARQITIAPYLDDPLRARFEQLATKRYVFTLSDAVPGGVLSIRTQVDGAGGAAAPPLLAEEMSLAPPAAPRQP